MESSPPDMKCKNCGAPIPYVAGENVLTCSYCGSTTMIASLDNIVKVEEHFIIPNTLDSASLQKNCRVWMSKGFFKAADLDEAALFGKIEGLYLPFWVVNARADTYWSGMNRRTRTVGSGDNRRTEEYWVPDSGSFQENPGWVIYARANLDEYYGLGALNPGETSTSADWGGFAIDLGLGDKESAGIDLATGKKPFSVDVAKGLTIINGQIAQEQAEDRAKAQIVGYHREKAEAKVDRLTDCDTTVQVERTELIYAPMWFVEYKYKGKTYRMLLEGYKGRVISGEAPVGKWDKVVVSGIIGGLVAIGCGIGGYYSDIPALYIGTAIAVLGVGIHATITALKKD